MSAEKRSVDPLKLMLLAETSALRALLVGIFADKFLKEPDPLGAAKVVRNMFARTPTRPPADGNLDPAISDVLTAMTDEAIDDIMNAVVRRIEGLRVAI
jgi:hypothetical protein